MKKLKYLLLLPFLLLASCGAKDICGTYGFAMGNVGGSHFGMYATLKADAYVDPEGHVLEGKRQFQLDLDLPLDKLVEANTKSFEPKGYVSTHEESDKTDLGSINGYYYVGAENEDGMEICIGVDLIDKIFEELFHWEITSADLMEMFVCAYITDGILNIKIPVSLEDLQMQLLWYGYYVNLDTLVPTVTDLFEVFKDHWPVIGVPSNSKRRELIGTIPDTDAIEEIRMKVQMRTDIFGEDFIFRAHHIVNLGLTKL